MNLTQCGQLVE